jgi:hypothetical protein
MTFAQSLGNDQVKRPPGCLRARVAEDAFRAGVPVCNGTIAVGRDNRIRSSHDRGRYLAI